jgi:hypothetical protein
MTSTISISASAFAEGITGKKCINYVDIFNPRSLRLSKKNKQFLNSDAFKNLKKTNLKEWKEDVVAELKKKKVPVNGEPFGNRMKPSINLETVCDCSHLSDYVCNACKNYSRLCDKLEEAGLDEETAEKWATLMMS